MANRTVSGVQALYLYGISKGPASPSVKSPGIDGAHPVRALKSGQHLCWVSAVDAGFARSLESQMENLEWLALHSVRHQQVVAEIAERSTVVPARFGTIFSGEAALLADVEGRQAGLQRVFGRIESADEWGVKVFQESRPVRPVKAKAGSGKDYLRQKAAQIKRPAQSDKDGELQEFSGRLERIAADAAATGKVSGGQQGLLWQATFLVPRAKRRQWESVLSEFVEKWGGKRRIEVNGPWPPYSFVSDAE